jgi:hypothetical protein
MMNQIHFLITLGAYENSTMDDNKAGIVSDMVSLHRNETLWLEAKQPIPFQECVADALNHLQEEVIELAVDGTIFPKEGTDFIHHFREMTGAVCEELELDISFDGYSYEEAQEITADKETFMTMIQQNQLEFSHLAYDEDERICILSIEQLQKLAVLSVKFDVYTYFDRFEF